MIEFLMGMLMLDDWEIEERINELKQIILTMDGKLDLINDKLDAFAEIKKLELLKQKMRNEDY